TKEASFFFTRPMIFSPSWLREPAAVSRPQMIADESVTSPTLTPLACRVVADASPPSAGVGLIARQVAVPVAKNARLLTEDMGEPESSGTGEGVAAMPISFLNKRSESSLLSVIVRKDQPVFFNPEAMPLMLSKTPVSSSA